jgi:creatinine amidohydrolase
MSETVLMEEMTWPEIKRAMETGKDTAILVAAAIEQHGPHLPTATDTIIGYALADAVAKQLGNALVAPVIRPALSRHHIDFAGTITLRMATFVKVLEEYCLSLKAHGFKRIVLFVSHGGNTDALKAFTPSIAKKIGPDIQLLFVYSLKKNMTAMQEQLNQKGITLGKAGVHSGFTETSIMLMLRPELVDMDRAAPGLTDEAFYQPENIDKSKINIFIQGIKSQAENGILGDPTGANADIGKKIFDAKVKDITSEITSNL